MEERGESKPWKFIGKSTDKAFLSWRQGPNVLTIPQFSEADHLEYKKELHEMRRTLPDKIESLSSRLESKLLQFHPLNLLATLFLRELWVDPESFKESEHRGMGTAVEYAALLLLKHPPNLGSCNILREENIHEIRGVLREIFDLTVSFYSTEPIEDSPDAKATTLDECRFLTLNSELFVRCRGYEHHTKQLLIGLFTPFESVLRDRFGFTIDDALKIEEQLKVLAFERVNGFRNHIFDFIRETNGELKHYRLTGAVFDERHLNLIKDLAKLSETESKEAVTGLGFAYFFNHSAEVFSFTLEHLAHQAGVVLQRCKAFLEFVSTEFGTVQKNFHLPCPTHPLMLRPIIKCGAAYFLPTHELLLWNLRERIEEALKPGNNPSPTISQEWEKYTDFRGEYLERETLKAFSDVLPNAQIYPQAAYWHNSEREKKLIPIDGLIFFDGHLLLVECKAGSVTPPAKRGAKQRLCETLKKLVVDAHEQLARAENFVSSTPEVVFESEDGRRIRFEAGKIKKIFQIIVTLEPLDVFSASFTRTVQLGLLKSKSTPWLVSFSDLKVISEMIEFPSQFIHYLQKRLIANAMQGLYANDELDWFGCYFIRTLDIRPAPIPKLKVFLASHSAQFDDYYAFKNGIRKTPAAKPTQKMPRLFRQLVSEIDASGLPGRSRAVCELLDLDDEGRVKVVKRLKTIRNRVSKDGRFHDFAIATDTMGLTVTAARWEERDEAENSLRQYASMKQKELGVQFWIAVLTLTADTKLVSLWFTTNH